MDAEIIPSGWIKYEAGQAVEVEALQWMIGEPWLKATIIKPIESAANCYEVEYENKIHGIVHAYRLRAA